MSDYYILITDAGAALESAAHASGTTVALAKFGVCDGGVDFTPDPTLTTFANEVYNGPISSLAVSTDDPAVLVAQCVIPSTSGGYTIRGIALYASDGTLYATGNYPDQQKPATDSGYSASLEILAQLAVSDTADITLQVVDGSYLTETEADSLYLRQDKNLGEIAAAGTDAQSASRSHLGLGDSATLNVGTEAGTVAAGDDPRFGGGVSGTFPIGVPFDWPLDDWPNNVNPDWATMAFAKLNGAAFDGAAHPVLAQMYPSLTLPDMRGRFKRGFDDGAGVDAGRVLLSNQDGAAPNITGSIPAGNYFDVPAGGTGALSGSGASSEQFDADQYNASTHSGINFDASLCSDIYSNDVTELRPDNTAWNFMVRIS